MENKVCRKCNEEKDICNFNKDKKRKDGLTVYCKSCQKLMHYNYYKNNKEKLSIIKKEYWDKNKEEINLKRLEYHKIYNSKRITTEEQKENKRIYSKEYEQKNKEKIKEYKKEYKKNRYKTDNLFKLKCNVRNLINDSFRSKNVKKIDKTEKVLGCSFEEFKVYLESKFENWMTWENKGLYNGDFNYGWDIDHIIPSCSASNESDLILLNRYTNLQPLCSKINRDIKKGDI